MSKDRPDWGHIKDIYRLLQDLHADLDVPIDISLLDQGAASIRDWLDNVDISVLDEWAMFHMLTHGALMAKMTADSHMIGKLDSEQVLAVNACIWSMWLMFETWLPSEAAL